MTTVQKNLLRKIILTTVQNDFDHCTYRPKWPAPAAFGAGNFDGSGSGSPAPGSGNPGRLTVHDRYGLNGGQTPFFKLEDEEGSRGGESGARLRRATRQALGSGPLGVSKSPSSTSKVRDAVSATHNRHTNILSGTSPGGSNPSPPHPSEPPPTRNTPWRRLQPQSDP